MEMEFSPLSLLILIFLLTALYLFKSYPLIRTLPIIIKNSHRLVDWTAELLLESPTGTVTVSPLVFTADPINVEHITKSHFSKYPKSNSIMAGLHDFMGDGIVNSDGEPWKLQRKMASYEFSTSSLRTFVLEKVRNGIQERLLPLLDSASSGGEVLDLQDVLERFAFDSICSIVFDYDPHCLSKKNDNGERMFHAFDEAARLSVERLKLPFSIVWKFKKLLNFRSERRLRESMKIINEYFAESFIRMRRVDIKSPERRDFLSQFAKDRRHSDEFLRDMLISFLVAGRDTTPSALTWFFWLISSRPDIARKILQEIRFVRSSQEIIGESFTLDSIREMHYLHAAMSESMRLYPPVSLLSRECHADDTLPDGTAVKKGWMMMYNVMAMGRTERIWGEDCLEYKPERWLVDGVFRPRSPFEYTVFHSGPRLCLGKEMAFIQMKAVAASILERFEIELVGERGKHQVSMALRMEGGLPVRVKRKA